MIDPRSLIKAAHPGRLRDITLTTWRAARADPDRAASILRARLREARALHSWERRLASDGLRAMIRLEGRLSRTLGTDEPEALWLGWLVSQGLDPAETSDPERFARCADLEACLAGLDAEAALAVRASVPANIAHELRRAYGSNAEAFVGASEARAPVVLRVSRRPGRDAILARVPQGSASALSPSAVILPPGTDVRALGLSESTYEIQDDASQAVAALVPAGVQTVLDLCAGAGGKTLALVDHLPGARITATDTRDAALRELDQRARRAHARVRILPPGVDPGDGYDAVLVDVPCTGTGTWRRHPELRWRLHHLPELMDLQATLLHRGAARVRPGGVLVYATCSVLPCEDEDAVEAFLRMDPRFRLEHTLRTAPHATDSDGLFGAVLRRRG